MTTLEPSRLMARCIVVATETPLSLEARASCIQPTGTPAMRTTYQELSCWERATEGANNTNPVRAARRTFGPTCRKQRMRSLANGTSVIVPLRFETLRGGRHKQEMKQIPRSGDYSGE